MVAQIERNPRQGVELSESPPPLAPRDVPAVCLAYALVLSIGLALFTGIVWPALLLAFVALAWPSPATRRVATPRRRRRRMTRAGITAAALVGWAASYFLNRSI